MLQASQQAEVKAGKGIEGRSEPLNRRRWLAKLLTDRSKQCPNAWRLRVGNLEQTLKPALFGSEHECPLDSLFRGQLTCAARAPQEIEERRIHPGKGGPGLWAAGVDDRIVADEFPRQAE